MKNKLYYVLFLLYAAVAAFVLYLNGVFDGGEINLVNVLINVGFLIIIGILFLISTISFGRLNRCTDELVAMTDRLPEEFKAAGGKNVWSNYQDRRDVFADGELNLAFYKFRNRMKSYRTKRGYSNTCDIDEFINEDLIDKIGMSYFNSGIAGTMTGLGILGTFLGLAMGLGSFNGDDIYTISDNVGPLLSGMKVAFHTSVYGIFFSIIFNFIYRGIMSDAYEKLEEFQNAFRQYAMPTVATEDENSAAMVIYQAGMVNSLKQMVELLKGNSMEQTAGVERIVNQFTEQMTATLGVQFGALGSRLDRAVTVQEATAEKNRELLAATEALLLANRGLQEACRELLESQAIMNGELNAQKEKLVSTCDEITNDISNQLYAFGQMRNLYEK